MAFTDRERIKKIKEQKRRWLCRYRRMVDEIYSLECLEQESLTTATGTSANVLDGMPRSPQSNNKSETSRVKHLEVGEDLNELKERANITRREISDAINKLDDSQQAKLLRLKYINGFEWPELMGIMGYSRGGLYGLHSRALDNIEIPTTELRSD